jgi:hypothetical protein
VTTDSFGGSQLSAGTSVRVGNVVPCPAVVAEFLTSAVAFYLSQLFKSNLSSEILEARVGIVVMRRLRISVLELPFPTSTNPD